MDEDQVGQDPGISRVALAGPDPEPTHDEFMADLYPKVLESLKFPANEHVILEDPLSSTETLSSMKNLDDAYVIGDQFINDKSTDDESRKLNVEAEVVSMVTILIYQASSSVPPLSTPVIDLSPPKPASSTTQTPIFTATTTTPLPPPPQQQSITKSELAERVAALEKKLSDLEDLPHKINEAVCENVKEAVQIALQAPLRDRFRDLSEEYMKEMLHQRMFETGSYKSLSEHIALYEALEASMKRAQGISLSLKRISLVREDMMIKIILLLHQTQIKVREDDMTLALLVHHSHKLLNHQHRRKDTDSSHLPKTKQRPECMKPIPDDERPATPKHAWVIPTSHILDVVNNWANALATTYQDPTENSLLEKTRDMRTFMNWYCQKMGKTELTQADLEGQAYEVVKPFYPDVVHLQFQMEECHKMLTDQIDWADPEGDQVRIDISKPLLLSGPPGHTVNQARKVVKTHMVLLSVCRIKSPILVLRIRLQEMKITLCRADHQEYTIAEKDFKNFYPSDFEDLNLLLLQGHLNHLPSSDIHMLSTVVKLWTRNLFNDGTLTNIMEALDYKVKEYKVNRLNPGMNTQFWTDKDVERSKEFIHAIEWRLKTIRIFRNLECFVGERVRDIDYRLLQRME
ncbi:hypothetical protein Tco_0490869 [Tanacetum coccineum]